MRKMLLSLLFLVTSQFPSQSADCLPIDVEISTTPIIEQTPRRLSKAKEFSKMEGETDILIIGDSIAEQWGKTQGQDFSGMSVVNMGLGGEKTQELLWRLKNLPPKINPARIILVIGTNNLRQIHYPACEVFEGILLASRELKALWPQSRLSILQLLPMGKDFAFRASDRAAVNDMVETSAEGATFSRVDEDLITCGWQPKGCENYRADHLHPQGAGYAILRRAVD